MHVSGDIIIFDTIGADEQPFADWCSANPNGYVAKIGRGTNKHSPVKLHEATCRFINSKAIARKGFIGPEFYKVCSLKGPELIKWVREGYQLGQWGEVSDDWMFCHPKLVP